MPSPPQSALRLYDTRRRAVRPFEPLQPGHVGIYVCGPTVQAAPHVGHLRSAVVVDLLHRWLLASGCTVSLVRNITDIDDKIIHDAAHADEPWWALATRQARAFDRAHDAIQILPPVGEPRVSGSISAIVELVAELVGRGHAYESDGDVYLAVRSVEGYGSLSGQTLDHLRASDRSVPHGHTGAKRDPLDFALWKRAKPGEPQWPSPWGPGRPGWHIECSAMAVGHLGEEFDIHAGGQDLVFPHHENELAQSTAAGHAFARYWLHHGLVTPAGGTGEKMSKSLGNATAVSEVLAGCRAPVLRYALAAAHYRSPLEWSERSLSDAESAYTRIESFVRNATDVLGTADGDAGSAGKAAWEQFAAALDDDLGVPQALAVVHATVRAGNAQLAAREHEPLTGTLAVLRRMLHVLGLDPVGQWAGAGTGQWEPVVEQLVGVAAEARAAARARGDWAAADAVRDRLAAVGLVLEDTPDGVRWRLS